MMTARRNRGEKRRAEKGSVTGVINQCLSSKAPGRVQHLSHVVGKRVRTTWRAGNSLTRLRTQYGYTGTLEVAMGPPNEEGRPRKQPLRGYCCAASQPTPLGRRSLRGTRLSWRRLMTSSLPIRVRVAELVQPRQGKARYRRRRVTKAQGEGQA